MKQAEHALDRPTDGGRDLAPRHREFRQVRSERVVDRENRRLAARIEELERERAQQDREHRELKDFVAMAAHEMLNPLVMTEAYAMLIAERSGYGLELESRHDLSTLAAVSARARLTVEALLNDARDSDRPLTRQHVDLSQVLEQCLDTLEPEIRAREARVDVDPMPVVEGNPALLAGVFGNLLSNALKYGPRDGGAIHVSVARSDAGWTFAVQSPGPAIPSRERERIFDPWQRGREERRVKGAGLGLAIVRRIVERHGGEVGVTSPSESTNRFFFTLPNRAG
jgi:two-component system, chemotaxis family, sensor kinase Cph1